MKAGLSSIIFLCLVFFSYSASAVMLYRSGNASKAVTKIRVGTDTEPVGKDGKIPASNAKGISTFSDKSKLSTKNLWQIDSAHVPAGFKAINDHGTHYSLVLTEEMTEADALAKINQGWTKVPDESKKSSPSGGSSSGKKKHGRRISKEEW